MFSEIKIWCTVCNTEYWILNNSFFKTTTRKILRMMNYAGWFDLDPSKVSIISARPDSKAVGIFLSSYTETCPSLSPTKRQSVCLAKRMVVNLIPGLAVFTIRGSKLQNAFLLKTATWLLPEIPACQPASLHRRFHTW